MSILKSKDIALLKGKNFAYIATLNSDGSPEVAPFWADTDGTNVLINAAIGSVEESNTARDPRVAVSLHDMKNPYSWISLEGKVVSKITDKQADYHIQYLSLKYTGKKEYEGSSGEKRAILVVEPTRVRQGK